MKNNLIGGTIVALLLIAAIVYSQSGKKKTSSIKTPEKTAPESPGTPSPSGEPAPQRPVRVLSGEVGGEKWGFLQDEAVRKILLERHGIRLDASKAGSIEMVSGAIRGDLDFLWPSSQLALQIFRTKHAQLHRKSEVIFNSPLVLYSWDIVVDALMKAGIAKQEDGVYYLSDFGKLVEMVLAGRTWEQIGLPELYGRILVISTDPLRSNSGNSFAALLANALQQDVVDETTVEKHIPNIKAFFAKLGYMEHSSGDLFLQFLRTGVGAKPIIVGYENQIIEFAAEHRDVWHKVRDRIRILYPIPTVWSSHPLIVLRKDAEDLVPALADPELMKIAWERHGFRTGLMDAQNDPSVLQMTGIPAQIRKAVPMPTPAVMQKIMDALQSN